MKVKQVLQFLFFLAITVVLLEVTSLLLFSRLTGRPFSYAAGSEARLTRIKAINKELGGEGKQSKALYNFHPYTGYVGNPGAFPWGEKYPAFNNFGLLSTAHHPYPYKKKKNEYVVAIVGGSVASIFANIAEEQFDGFIRDRLGFKRKVVFVNLATGGYKQPQQLFQLQYALLSGFEIDAVLNIDGFNEIALTKQNMLDDANPIFPSIFHMALMSQMNQASIPDKRLAELFVEYYETYEHEQVLLSFINTSPFRYSVFLNMAGELWTARNRGKIKNIKYKTVTVSSDTVSGVFSGPDVFEGRNSYDIAARVWLEASRMLNAICRENDLLYIHVLQPNQYVEGSKKLTPTEKKIAINPDNEWGKAAREGYGRLIADGEILKQDGIPFYDLTMIYKDIPKDVYFDDCCHMNPYGNLLLARRIAHIFMAEMKRREINDSGR